MNSNDEGLSYIQLLVSPGGLTVTYPTVLKVVHEQRKGYFKLVSKISILRPIADALVSYSKVRTSYGINEKGVELHPYEIKKNKCVIKEANALKHFTEDSIIKGSNGYHSL
jgi:hypothetical protein